jgi:N-acetylglucosamine-6-phosphate deacetylase
MQIIDAKGGYTGPGLIDIHTHSDGKIGFFRDPVSAAETLLNHGVTTVLPALYFSRTADELISQVATIREAMQSGKADNIFGIYMEAPYMNPSYGSHRDNNPWRFPVNKDDYGALVDKTCDMVRVWALAPERENILEFVKYAKEKNPDVVFAVGHSEAEPYQIDEIVPYGLKTVTHTTNATGTLQKYPECRTACVDEFAYYNDQVYAELICDKVGIHVQPYMLRLIKKFKGDDRIILISDAASFIGESPIPDNSDYEGADDIDFDDSGEIAGTKIKLDGAARNMMVHTGASLCQVFKYASSNPATMLGFSDRGFIRKGLRADLITVNAEFDVQSVYIGGKKIK